MTMEWKIGEIKQVNGEWYQCVFAIDGCRECSFRAQDYCTRHSECLSDVRSDGISVIFKKLEKVGEPFTSVGKLYQHYKVFDIDNVYGDVFWCVHNYKAKTLTIEIKQNKEDMKEKKLNLKPFSLELAKAGKPVCTRDGKKARIICFDKKGGTPIVGLIQEDGFETVATFNESGLCLINGAYNLMMLPEKKEGWVNVYKKEQNRYVKGFFPSREIALNFISEKSREYIATIKITWEE